MALCLYLYVVRIHYKLRQFYVSCHNLYVRYTYLWGYRTVCASVWGALKIAASNLNVINNPFSFTNNNYLSVGIRTVCEWAKDAQTQHLRDLHISYCMFCAVCMCNQQVLALHTYLQRIFAQVCFHCGVFGGLFCNSNMSFSNVLFNGNFAFLLRCGRTVSVCLKYLASKNGTAFWKDICIRKGTQYVQHQVSNPI